MIFLQIIILVNNRTKKRGRHSNFTTLCSAATKAATISLDEDQRAVRLVRSISSFSIRFQSLECDVKWKIRATRMAKMLAYRCK